MEQSIAHFENITNITIDSASVIPQEKKRKRGRFSGEFL